jgi:hypothetical protein
VKLDTKAKEALLDLAGLAGAAMHWVVSELVFLGLTFVIWRKVFPQVSREAFLGYVIVIILDGFILRQLDGWAKRNKFPAWLSFCVSTITGGAVGLIILSLFLALGFHLYHGHVQ